MNDIITQDTYDIIKHQARDLDLVVINRDAYKYGQPTNIALGANIAGFEKVMDAMIAQGVC